MSLPDKLERLNQLRLDGVLSAEEFQAAKERLLGGGDSPVPSAPSPQAVPSADPPATLITQPASARRGLGKFEDDGQLRPIAVRFSLATAIFWLFMSSPCIGMILYGLTVTPGPNEKPGSAISPELAVGMIACVLPMLIPALIGLLSRRPKLVLSRVGLQGTKTGGRLILWSEVRDVSARSHYASELKIYLNDGSIISLYTLNHHFLDYSPDVIDLATLIRNRLETGRFVYPEAEKTSWKEVLIVVVFVVAMLLLVVWAAQYKK